MKAKGIAMSETKQEFKKQLLSHDWYYSYSDDPSYWRRGVEELSSLKCLHKELVCPFSLVQLRMWATGMVVEKFAEEEPGRWFMQPRGEYAASVTRQELIPQFLVREIDKWVDEPTQEG